MKRIAYHIFLPLVAGLAVYLFLRDPVTHIHQALGIKSRFFALPQSWLSDFILYHLPDMLWAYALTATLLLITRLKSWQGATVALILLSTAELSQANWHWNWLDWRDLGLMSIAVFLAIIFLKK